MIVEIGHYALALALGVSVIQVLVPFWGSCARIGRWRPSAAARR